MKPTIFVQMASYRDPELVLTLCDLIERAEQPEALRVVVCRQHALHETIGEFFTRGFGRWRVDTSGEYMIHTLDYCGASVELIDVPYPDSQGACWARNLIQQHYRGERYTLQLDSHHRFVEGWDRLSVDMLESLRPASAKPVLTAYLPQYLPHADPAGRGRDPLVLRFSRFSPQGVVMLRTIALPNLPDHGATQQPVPARFYSAHFAFADGCFATEVQHDPQYFFLGEEISISARAYTHGYDLYHPHCVVAWHEYTRKGRVKIWDDHSEQAKTSGTVPMCWGERDSASYRRNRALFGIDGEPRGDIDFGPYGLGGERTLAQYETYAGIDFARRGVQQATLDATPPAAGVAPERGAEADWNASLRRSNEVRVSVHQSILKVGEQEARACRLAVCDAEGAALHREALDEEAFSSAMRGEWLDRTLVFTSELGRMPANYVVELLDGAGNLLRRVEKPVKA